MCIKVENCFHWIGFHLINRLLEEGIPVIGIDQVDTPKKEYLSMYVARNDSFSLHDKEPDEKNFDLAFEVCDLYEDGDRKHVITLLKSSVSRKDTEHIIYPPKLIGEWMPSKEIISFKNEKTKLQTAACIENFISAIYQWIEIDTLIPSKFNVVSSKDRNISSVKLESYVYLRDNRSIQKYFDTVLDHYHRLQAFY